MTRQAFEQSLKAIQEETINLGKMVENAIGQSIDSLSRRDLELSQQIVSDDSKINQKRFEIEEKCVQLIATQQPMATDLRTLAAILNIITELERMADHAEGIAKINIRIGKEPLIKPLIDIPRMRQKACDMLRRSLEAFIAHDAESARKICAEDEEVDNLYNQVYRELLTYMLEDPRTITRATYLLWVAHNLERIADRVTNICERVIFLVTGKMQEFNIPH
jgi:phosphate transport system protein